MNERDALRSVAKAARETVIRADQDRDVAEPGDGLEDCETLRRQLATAMNDAFAAQARADISEERRRDAELDATAAREHVRRLRGALVMQAHALRALAVITIEPASSALGRGVDALEASVRESIDALDLAGRP